MHTKLLTKIILACCVTLFALGFGFFTPATINASTEKPSSKPKFTFDEAKRDIAKEILKVLEKEHYIDIKLNNTFSENFLKAYLKMFDPGRTHFTAKDIQYFNRYRNKLDDELKEGKLSILYMIYNRYHQRRSERLRYSLSIMEQGLDKIDFEEEATLELDREESPWPKNKQESEDLWYRLVKNDILNLKLSKKEEQETKQSNQRDSNSTDTANGSAKPTQPSSNPSSDNANPLSDNDSKQEPELSPEEEIVTNLTKRYKNQLRILTQINNEDVFEYVMTAFTHQYDPHTDYFPPRQSENFDIHMRLSLEGIGALLQQEDEYIKVVRLIPAGPADMGNELQPADRIIGVGQGVNGELVDVVGWRLDDVVDLIRGKKGSIVKLKVIPSDSTDFTNTKIIQITRDTVKLEEESAKKQIIEITREDKVYKIGVIELPTFYIDFRAALKGDPNFRSSTRDVERLIRELNAEDINGLIVDLRNNGGGSLREANQITGLFIRKGPVVQIRDARNRVEPQLDTNPSLLYQGPLIVMVNRLSASASEIFAGAIQDYEAGIVIGDQTFGKGSVQTIVPLEVGQLKYTQAKYYRVNGHSTQEKGVLPDIQFPSLLDHEDIGESTMPTAMAWDRITSAPYRKAQNLSRHIDRLSDLHNERIKEDPDFNYILERIEFLKENREKTHTSLKESERIEERLAVEQRLLDMENKRRKAKGIPLLKTYSELEGTQDSEENEKPSEIMLKEAANIVVDWHKLKEKQLAVN